MDKAEEKYINTQSVLRKEEGLGVGLQELSFRVFQVFHSPEMTAGFFRFLVLFL